MRNKFWLLLSILSFTFSWGQEGIHFRTNSLSVAKRLAKKEKKIIFVDGYTDWCAPCKWMEKYVFADDKVADFYNTQFINIKVNLEEGKGVALKNEYNISYFPTYLFLDENAEILHKVYGAKEPIEFIESGLMALNPSFRLSKFLQAPKSSWQEEEFLFEYALLLKISGDPKSEYAALNYLQTQDNWANPRSLQMIYDFSGSDLESELTQYFVANRNKFYSAVDTQFIDEKFEKIMLLNAPPESSFEGLQEFLHQHLLGDSSAFAQKITLKIVSGAVNLADHKQEYFPKAIEYFNNNSFEDAQFANNIAWNIGELSTSSDNLLIALAMVKKAIDLAPGYYNYDTQAMIHYKLKMLTEAKISAEKAIEYAIKNSINAKTTIVLLDKIKQASRN